MALNIPVNLMSISAHSAQTHSTPQTGGIASDVTVIKPATGGSDTGAASTGGGGDTSRHQHPALALKSRLMPSRAEPNSVLAAQSRQTFGDTAPAARGLTPAGSGALRAIAMIQSVATTPGATEERPNKIDRYAPPDPLPTAPILKNPTRSAPKPPLV